jgi:hypothetical protein
MSERPRGNHPHARVGFLQDTGPASWANKLETDRWNWDERYVPGREDGNPDGNPLAQVGIGLGGRAGSLQVLPSGSKHGWTSSPQADKSKASPSARTPPGTRMKAPTGGVPSPPSRPIFADQGMLVRQREKRVEQLEARLGVDKVRRIANRPRDSSDGAAWPPPCALPLSLALSSPMQVQLVSSPLQIDTTAQAGHNTAAAVPRPTGSKPAAENPTMRGHNWPVTHQYFERSSTPSGAPRRQAYYSAGWAQTVRQSS